MDIDLSPAQLEAQAGFREFVDTWVAPFADEHDRQQQMPPELVQRLAAAGYLGGLIPTEYGGGGMDALTWGLLCGEIGRGSASLLSLFTVHCMASQILLKWGSEEQRQRLLPKMATGEVIGAFGLTEPNVGSDAKSIETTAVADGDFWVLNGRKRWTSCGQIASAFIMFAQVDGRAAAFLVERGTPGLSTEPITGLLGFRSAMIAEVNLDNCRIPAANLIGRVGFGFSHVGSTGLDHGRFCIAWGCLGLAQGALDASLAYTSERKQYGVLLKTHQLIQELVADMITQIQAAKMLCYYAAFLKDRGDPSVIMETSLAKYFASRMCVKVASDAVQVHGGNGCSDRYPVARYYRDAKIMEIIEGSNQMQQMIISSHGYQGFIRSRRQSKRGE